MHLGIKIKFARIAKGLSQEELAAKIKKTRPLVSHIEQTGKVNPKTLQMISDALGKSIEELESIEYPITNKKKPKTVEERHQEEITSLENENRALRDLISSQKEIIKMLKEQLSKVRK